MKRMKSIVLWIVAAFFLLMALPFFPSFGSFLLLLASVITAPVQIIQYYVRKTLSSLFKKQPHPIRLQILLTALIAFLGICFSGTSVEPTAELPPSPSPAESSPFIPEESGGLSEKASIASPTPAPTLSPSPTVTPAESSFVIHFIDVGQADCALVLCDGQAMLIDGGNSADSDLIYSYLQEQGVDYLDYIIATHGHEDHVGGLAGALNYAQAGTAYCSVAEYDSDAFQDFVKYLERQGVELQIPTIGTSFTLGSAYIDILGVDRESDNPNNSSIILRIVYGDTSFLFTGDAEREAEERLLDSGADLKSTLIKVGHHGSENASSYPLLYEAAPEYAVISVGADNNYGHPSEAVLSRLRDADVITYRSDLQGHIICESDGKSLSFTVERNPDAETLLPAATPTPEPTPAPTPEPTPEPESEPVGTNYILNTNSKKFHYPSCGSAGRISDANKDYYTGSRAELISWGYSPCGNCDP